MRKDEEKSTFLVVMVCLGLFIALITVALVAAKIGTTENGYKWDGKEQGWIKK